MSLITRTYTFTDGTTAYGSQVESEIANIVNTINNLDTATTKWDQVSILNASGVPLVADNSSGSQDVVDFKVNGVTKVSVSGTGVVSAVNGISISGAPLVMNSQKITGVATPTTSGDALSYGNVINGTTLTLSSTVNSNVQFSNTSTQGIVGATNGGSAATGNVGEYIESVVTFTNCPSTGTWGDLTSISLTAGDWDITGVVESSANGATITRFIIGISSTTGNSTVGLTDGSNQIEIPIALNGVRLAGGVVPSYRVLISGTTTYYLKMNASYTVATAQAAGRLSARRLR